VFREISKNYKKIKGTNVSDECLLFTKTDKTAERIRNPLLCPTELRAQIPVFVAPHNVLKEKRISDKFSSTLHSTGQYCKKIKGELCCLCELDP